MPTPSVRGAIASGHRETSAAAAGVLQEGGNAFDAALAAGFAACVAEPMFTSFGGGGFLLTRSAEGEEVLFDFFVDAPGRGRSGALTPHFVPVTVRFPASEQIFHAGHGSVAVPGTLAGLLHAHARLGSLSLARIVAPAERLARRGIELNPHQAYVQGLLEPILTLSPAGRALYTPAGRVLRAGERLVNPELAAFLARLPETGGRDVYAGGLAERVAEEMERGGGLLTAEDLRSYRVIERAPLAFEHAGCRVLTNPAPALGGDLLAAAFVLLARPEVWSEGWGSPAHLLALTQALVEVEQRRTPAAGGTTHLSVCDAAGNAASLSLSNGEGSGAFVSGTGIQLNNMLGEDDLHPGGFHALPPGQRVGSMMSPTLVLQGDRVVLALGSGGSKRIRSAILQVATAVLDAGLPLRDAVEAPRVHWDGEVLQLEPGFSESAVAALAERWPLNAWPERNLYFGGVHAADPRGAAAADPRREGHACLT